jgi:hypothetical protein
MTFTQIIDSTTRNSDGSIGHSNQLISIVLLAYFLVELCSSFSPAFSSPSSFSFHTSPSSSSSPPLFEEDANDRLLLIDDCCVFVAHQLMAAVYVVSAITKYTRATQSWFDSINLVLHIGNLPFLHSPSLSSLFPSKLMFSFFPTICLTFLLLLSSVLFCSSCQSRLTKRGFTQETVLAFRIWTKETNSFWGRETNLQTCSSIKS